MLCMTLLWWTFVILHLSNPQKVWPQEQPARDDNVTLRVYGLQHTHRLGGVDAGAEDSGNLRTFPSVWL